MSRRRRGFGLWISAGLALVLISLAAGAVVVRQSALRAELELARQAKNARRFGAARERLARLAQRWTNDGEVFLLLGECELELHRREYALAAWAQVLPTSPFFSRAALLQGIHLTNSGRYTPAEDVFLKALARPEPAARFELERSLARLYRFEGRFDDVRRVVRTSWCRSPDPAETLKQLWAHDHSPMPVKAVMESLEKADNGDDRVWLGRANYAILTGRFAAAAGWLDRCAGRRPDDPSVWQARLNLALASGDVDGFWTAAAHVPADRSDATGLHMLRAWLAARRGDGSLEQKELMDLLRQAPGNTQALERLAVLKFQTGRPHEAEQVHRRKAETDNAYDKIRRTLMDEAQFVRRAQELSELSAVVGRTFDAQGWAILAEARHRGVHLLPGRYGTQSQPPLPNDLAAKASELSSPFAAIPGNGSRAGTMVADRLADLRAAATTGREATRPRAAAIPGDLLPVTPEFIDDAEAAGLRFLFDNGQTPQRQLPETMAGGAGLMDIDGDGWLDVYCVQGGALLSQVDNPRKTTPPDGDRLFRNRGDGTFEDVTRASGIATIAWGRGYGLGMTVGDYDNDGHPDLFVTRLTSYALYRNRGDGTFEDATERAGLAGRRDNPTSAAFADLDNDGDLDLYVCHYMIWDPAHPRTCQSESGRYFYCSPRRVEPAPDHVFRNDGGRFVDVTASSGCAETNGRGLGVVAADLDDDKLTDLYVANDGTANYLFHNLGDFRFEEVALPAGVAGGAEGGYRAGMGVACGDLDGDGRSDLLVTNFYGEGTTLYHNLGNGLFADQSAASGIALATRYLLGFGIAMVDVTNDGRVDVVITNGHVIDNRPYYLYAMPSRLYENRPGGRLVDISAQAGSPWDVEPRRPRSGRR